MGGVVSDYGGCGEGVGVFPEGRVDFPKDRFRSCDDLGVAKPDLAAYRPLYGELERDGVEERWFAAAHMWDVTAAMVVG